ncbi:uncharacterized protein N7515_004312 [Penicillium bovifimosum]|uniref:Uncharacterized protein n=1 Tax=Penicillium bovifimosum TaxID=126998 RepID=A0A9W9GZW6_9EURO|nr:uncharacterized protein N7515_004312 [Penicillium bovifimosum]KAJ5135034.1 hypothetical protein N7515_004312 [Penicillium bovifimosum]
MTSSSSSRRKGTSTGIRDLKVIQELTANLMKNPMGEDWKKGFAQLKSGFRGKIPTPQRNNLLSRSNHSTGEQIQ